MTRATRLILLALLVAYPVVVIVLATSSGVLLSQDSVSYLAAARSFAEEGGLTSFDGEPLTLFPPGLSIVLGAGEALGASAESVAVALNALCAALIVVGTHQLGRLSLRSSWLALGAAAVVSLSAPFTASFVWLWSEPLFTVLVVGVLVLLAWMMRVVRCSWWLVIAAGLLVGAAISVRYVGYVLLPVVALGIWWSSRPRGEGVAASRALLRSAVAVLVALLAPVLIVMRNLGAGSGPLGDRYPGVRTLQDSAGDAVGVLGTFLLPFASFGPAVVIGAVVAVVVLVGIWSAVVDRDRVLMMLGLFALLYALAIVVSQTATRLDPPTPRLMGPALPAVAVLAVGGLRVLVTRMRRDASTWALSSPSAVIRARGGAVVVGAGWVALTLLALLAVVASIRADVRLVTDARGGELGLRETAAASSLGAAAVTLPEAGGFASNDPWRMYLAVGKAPVVPLPPSAAEWPAERLERDLWVLLEAVRSGEVTHALVVEGGGATQTWVELASAGLEATLVAETPEGDIYRLATVG